MIKPFLALAAASVLLLAPEPAEARAKIKIPCSSSTDCAVKVIGGNLALWIGIPLALQGGATLISKVKLTKIKYDD